MIMQTNMSTEKHIITAFLLLVPCVWSAVLPTLDPNATPSPTEDFPYNEQIDTHGNYFLFWDRNDTHITMEVHARTHGYVGFGLSKNGNMFPADIVIGWIKDGKVYFKDRHSVAHAMPLIDKSQDWILLHGQENSFGTILKFTRKHHTCDNQDLEIKEATMRVIYSYHPDDPINENSIGYHGSSRRGTRSVMFLSKSKQVTPPSDAINVDFVNDKFHVPSSDTTYQCTVFDVSWLGQKHHLIRFGPHVQPGNEDLVHHIVVYKCPLDRKYINVTYECYDQAYRDARPCSTAYLAWAVGGEDYNFPENIGLPVAEDGDNDLYIMQLHYNNPGRRSDYVDSSGLRLIVTQTLRPIEADEFNVNVHISPRYQIIPPRLPSFISTAYCPEKCLRKGLGDSTEGIRVIAIFQHAHLLARGIKTRLIRNGVELKPIADDSSYDFDFQDIRNVNRTIKPGDSIILECNYNSMNRSVPTYGGESTHEEMCAAFFYYYPRTKLKFCSSGPVFDNVPVPSSHIMDYIRAYDWSNSTKNADFQRIINVSKQTCSCGGTWGKVHMTTPVVYPNAPYSEQSTCSNQP